MKMYRIETIVIAKYRHFEVNTTIDICLVYKFQCCFVFLDANDNINTDSFCLFFSKWEQKTFQSKWYYYWHHQCATRAFLINNTGQTMSLFIRLVSNGDTKADGNGAGLPAWLDLQSATRHKIGKIKADTLPSHSLFTQLPSDTEVSNAVSSD